MKALILAGGYGTRIREVSESVPKPMIEVGGKPILWHIMKNLSQQGVSDFIICLGYKGSLIKNYFLNYAVHTNNIEIETTSNGLIKILGKQLIEDWNVKLIETGLNTPTGGRIFQAREIIGKDRFLCTYGDGLANLDLKELINVHEKGEKIATVTAVSPPSRFGVLEIDESGKVLEFSEKARVKEWVNGGFFILENRVFDFLNPLATFEKEPLESLAKQGQLQAYLHQEFWKPMDTYREYVELNRLWDEGNAPWKIW